MKAWEHKLTTVAIYSAVFSSAATRLNYLTVEYFIYGLAATVIGSHFPDFDIFIFGPGSSPDGFIRIRGHRGLMHYYKLYLLVSLPLTSGLIAYAIFLNFSQLSLFIIFTDICFFFAVFMHIAEDAPTTAGIPVKKFDKDLYVSYSYKMGNYNSWTIMLVALSVVALSGVVIIYNALNKFI
jgi:membrane-bound metal-dependent hydrolase YbcI (DUF457 family)